MKKKYAIFLGAGASAADGAPIQSNLFFEYFNMLKDRNRGDNFITEMLSGLFLKMFDIDVSKGSLKDIKFPSFEEVLGVLDLADLKNESFREFSNINVQTNSGGIVFLRLYLIFLMADILNERLQVSKGNHLRLMVHLNDNQLLDKTVFITSNYDILCDNAIIDVTGRMNIDYGIEFKSYDYDKYLLPDENSVKLYKLHGSLNWMHCPTCNNLQLTPLEKGIAHIYDEANNKILRCNHCHTVFAPIIVPPTFYKDMSKVFLGMVWNQAEKDLLEIDHLIFCGYSFPDADMHIKYLIKRIQKNRVQPSRLKISVLNNYTEKKPAAKKDEKNRYIRFLGQNVDYTDFSFEQFADNPMIVMR